MDSHALPINGFLPRFLTECQKGLDGPRVLVFAVSDGDAVQVVRVDISSWDMTMLVDTSHGGVMTLPLVLVGLDHATGQMVRARVDDEGLRAVN